MYSEMFFFMIIMIFFIFAIVYTLLNMYNNSANKKLRNLKLKQFNTITIGTSYREVLNILGEGVLESEKQINDKNYKNYIWYLNKSNKNNTRKYICICFENDIVVSKESKIM